MNFLDIAAYNAFVVFLSIHPIYMEGKSHRRRIFLEELACAMIDVQRLFLIRHHSLHANDNDNAVQSASEKWTGRQSRCA
jgi:hypothetical protein